MHAVQDGTSPDGTFMLRRIAPDSGFSLEDASQASIARVGKRIIVTTTLNDEFTTAMNGMTAAFRTLSSDLATGYTPLVRSFSRAAKDLNKAGRRVAAVWPEYPSFVEWGAKR